MSPVEYPSSIPGKSFSFNVYIIPTFILIIKFILDTSQIGSLFTLFLHAPLLGFAFISDPGQISSETWGKCVNLIAEAELKIVELFNSSNIGKIFCH
jgi:hypothetical protein